ncbi:MAG: hypothetical protein JWM89_781 [Acidimicrobiales bacterium]|nr:hypothetical protein [Acidimicrobiales bacterium]
MVVVNRSGISVARIQRVRWGVISAVAGAVGLLLALEITASRLGFEGPTGSFLHDFAFGPKRGPGLWAALALALVGLGRAERIRCLVLAAGIDLVFFLGRYSAGTRPTFGNGALIVLVGLGGWAAWRWQDDRRADALKGVAIGLLLTMATKVSDTWLRITAITQPHVLDEYVATADRSLGSPAWLVGRMVEASGDVGHLVLQTVYIELPVAAIVVAIYQLRRGWPAHHLVRSFLAIGVIGPVCYVLFPVVGPAFAFGGLGKHWAVADIWPAVDHVSMHPNVIRFDHLTPRNCMPSLHTAWAVAIFIHSRRSPAWLRHFGAFWLVATLTATLGFGYHYGVDLVAGVIFALTIESGLRDPGRGWGWFRWRLVGGGACTLAALLFSYRYLAVPLGEVPMLSGPLLLAIVSTMVFSFHTTFFADSDTVFAPIGRPAPAFVAGSSTTA